MLQTRILVVEDEVAIQNVVRAYLESAGYSVRCIDNGPDALDELALFRPNLIILDLNLPGMDGIEVASRIREESDVFILMLTARSEEEDRIAGLRIGADDYLTKPFSPRELVARVEAILRRHRAAPPTHLLRFCHIELDSDKHEAFAAGEPLSLTTTEFSLLYELMRHAGRVLTREQLIDRVWGENFYGNERVVDVFAGQVRRKLEQATGEKLIETVRGVGYKFVDEKK